MTKSILFIGVIVTFLIAGTSPAIAAGANLNPNSQSTSGGGAHGTESWSGGTGTFYPSSGGSLGHVPAQASYSYGFNSCPSTYVVQQELDVVHGGAFVASAVSSTTVVHTRVC